MPNSAIERFDLVGGTPFWLVKNGLESALPYLDRDIKAEVVIVGGGITGALCAFRLAEAGVDCVLVDGRSFATGSTSASTALLQYEIDTPLHKLKDLVGLDHAVRSYKACARAIPELLALAEAVGAPAARPRPSVQYASKRSHKRALEREWKLRREQGFDVAFASGDEVRSWLPFPAPAALRSSLGAEMDALEFTHALHRASMQRGLRMYERTPITAFELEGGQHLLTTQRGHRITAKYVVHATGYESQFHLPKPVLQLHSTYALISEAYTAVEPWPDHALLWETAVPYLYLRTAAEGRIIVGGRDEKFRDPKLRDRLLDRKTKQLVQDVRQLMPQLHFEREFAWCGTFGSTKDGLPYIDRSPEQPNTWFALGMGGNGITFSSVAAEVIRDGILGRQHPDAELFRFNR